MGSMPPRLGVLPTISETQKNKIGDENVKINKKNRIRSNG
jgi:hypothetical protein